MKQSYLKKGNRMIKKQEAAVEVGDWVRVRKTMHTMRENVHAKYEMTREGRVLQIKGKFKQLALVRINLRQLATGQWDTQDSVFSHKVITVLEKAPSMVSA